MSQGPMENYLYIADDLSTHPIRLNPETIGLTVGTSSNSGGEPPADSKIPAKASGGKRESALIARKVFVKFATAPAGYKANGVIGLPWLNPTTFAGIARGAVGSYLGEAIEVVGKSPEYPI